MVWREGLVPWAIFLLSAAVIVYAGTKLSRYGDQIADLTGLGGLWIGVVLMAGAASLPEIFTDVSAALMNAPDLAAGDLFGSNMANMVILGIIGLMHRQKRVWQQAAFEHALSAGLALFLTGLAAFFVLYGSDVKHGGLGLGSMLLLLFYIFGMRVVFRQEMMKRRQREQDLVVEGQTAGESKQPSKRGGGAARLHRICSSDAGVARDGAVSGRFGKRDCRAIRDYRDVHRYLARGHRHVAAGAGDRGRCRSAWHLWPGRRELARE